MKKLLAILLVCAFAFSFVACGGGDESSAPASFGGNDSKPAEEPQPSSEPSSEVEEPSASEDPSTSEPDTSEPETPDEPAEKKVTQFVSWGKAYFNNIVNASVKDATSLSLNKVNAAVAEGENGVFTVDNAIALAEGADAANFAIVVFKYEDSLFGYIKNDVQAFGSAKVDTKVPEDGFALVIAKANESKFNAIKSTADSTIFYPHGFVVNDGLDSTIVKTETAPTIDGTVESGEYGDVVWSAAPENNLFSYGLFEAGKYNVNADIYMTYDAEYLYIGVVVDTPDHYNDCTPEYCGDMYDKTCIQVNVMGISPKSDTIIDGAWDYRGGNRAIADNNVIRQYGFGVNPDTKESLKCVWMGAQTDNSVSVNSRVDQITTYEAMIPWADLGSDKAPVEIKEGSEIGISISINSGTPDRVFQVLCMRDGGGIIGINDFTKIPAITLG